MLSLFDPKSSHHWSWVSLIGPDAPDFLHRLTTVNVRNLDVGQGAPGCFLNPQGRIRSYFRLWQFGQTEYAFEFDAGKGDHWKQELLAAIDQFTFGENITLADVTALDCLWIFGDSGLSIAPGQTVAIDDEIRLCHQGSTDFGHPWITAWGRPERLKQWADRQFSGATQMPLEDVERWRIQSLRPRMDQEITETTNPLEVGIPEAVAINKGCYPGQEVIEKISALGAPAKRLARIEGPGKGPQLGEKIFNDANPEVEVGEITSVSQIPDQGFAALAIIRKIHAKEGLPVKLISGTRAQVTRIAPYA